MKIHEYQAKALLAQYNVPVPRGQVVFSAEEARRQLDIAIDWGRYGELFEYDSESGQLVLGSDPAKVGA